MRAGWVGVLALGAAAACAAQQPIGSVAMQDATVSGALEVTEGKAVLVGSSSVTAKDHAAEVALQRGGVVEVCQTSGLHLSSGTAGTGLTPLMLALDRGAVEVRMLAGVSDVILTPDLRFSVRDGGPLDLRLRVGRNGDTCVEQRGAQAPTLVITDVFGDLNYEVHAGQHVMFEHGSLREVVDHETSPCGCPPALPDKKISLAEAALRPPGDKTASLPPMHDSPEGRVRAPEDAGAAHPFPAAQSVGLAPEPEAPQAKPGEAHTQITTTLSYEAPKTAPAPEPAAASKPTAPAAAGAPAQAAAEKKHGAGHAIGRFFKRLFGGGSKD